MPMQQFEMSDAGMELTRSFEGLQLKAYEDCAGIWTIGYGHTGGDVHAELEITELDADALLKQDMRAVISCVNSAVTAQIRQSQFDALADFCFNVGERRLLGSTLLRYVNSGNFTAAAGQFGMWVHAGGKVQPGLVKRRQAEAALFASES